MNSQSEKLDLIQEILYLESDDLLHRVRDYLHSLKQQPAAGEDYYPRLPPRSAAEIEENYQQALREAESGDVFTHEEVVAMTQQWRKG